jgi:hypothetical protein
MVGEHGVLWLNTSIKVKEPSCILLSAQYRPPPPSIHYDREYKDLRVVTVRIMESDRAQRFAEHNSWLVTCQRTLQNRTVVLFMWCTEALLGVVPHHLQTR